MQKKLIISLILTILLSNSVSADSKTSKTLSRIENNLFGIEYTDKSETERLSRIEEQVYGESKNGSIKSRLEDLSKDIATNQMGQEITPKKDTFDDENDYYEQNKLAQTQQEEYREPDNPNIDYPAVNELEEQIFGKTYKNLDINTRLSKLEKETFRKTYEDALSDRVDRLKNKVAYETRTDNNGYSEQNPYTQNDLAQNYNPNDFGQDENYFSPQTIAQNNDNGFFRNKNKYNENFTDKELNTKLKKLEKNVFKQSFTNDSPDNRLSRLESTIFNTNFPSDEMSTRINRISSAVEAQKTAKKYDSNGLQQKMATAMQIGMFVLMVVAMIL